MSNISDLILKFRTKNLTSLYPDIDSGTSPTNFTKIKNDINKLIDVIDGVRPGSDVNSYNYGTTCVGHLTSKITNDSNLTLSNLTEKIDSLKSLSCNIHNDLTCGCVANTWQTCSCNSRCSCDEKRSCVSSKSSNSYVQEYVSHSCSCNTRCACNSERAFR